MTDFDAIHMALRTQLLTASGLPASGQRAFENTNFTPTVGTPWIDDAFVPATNDLLTGAKNGTLEARGLYVVRWYGLVGETARQAIRAGTAAILAVLYAGWSTTLGNGDTLHIAGKPGPVAKQILPMDRGFAMCPVQVSWFVYSINPG